MKIKSTAHIDNDIKRASHFFPAHQQLAHLHGEFIHTITGHEPLHEAPPSLCRLRKLSEA
jgi:hypothetical protein